MFTNCSTHYIFIHLVKLVADPNRCAEGNDTFCTKDDSYPLDLVESILQQNLNKYDYFFGSDEIPQSVVNRDSNMDDIELCESYTDVIYPQSGENEKGVKVFIFNTENHKQGVRVSMCKHSGKACNNIISVPNDHHTECRQEYVYKELLSISPEKAPIKDKFKFPVCCSCAVYRT